MLPPVKLRSMMPPKHVHMDETLRDLRASTVLHWCEVGLTCNVWLNELDAAVQHAFVNRVVFVMSVSDHYRQHTAQQTVA